MGVRVYGSIALAAKAAAREAHEAELIQTIKALLAFGPPPPRPRYPADDDWNAERRRERRRRWLLVGNPDGSGFTRRPGPYRLPAECADDGHTVVWYGKDICVRYVSKKPGTRLRRGDREEA